MPPPPEKCGFRLYKEALNDPKCIVAPMVDASELAWRMLARRYKADLCYTPMWHSAVFARDEKYRKNALQTCPQDRPLIVQFCANDPETFKKAVQLTINSIECDAIDLNLGCPQIIAKRGHFGSFLQDDWELITKLVKIIHDNFDIPITCKMRIFEDVNKTVKYAQMMEQAGCQILTVHGRTREQKGALTGLASWDHIKAVVEALKIPVVANGNIQYLEDVHKCIQYTGVCGVMSAEGHLTNPALFSGTCPPVWQMALEYLDLVDQFPCPLSYARGHIFKLLHHVLQIKSNSTIRDILAKGQSLQDFRTAVIQIQEIYQPYESGDQTWNLPPELEVYKLKHPPWHCQPYVRPPPEEHLKKLEEIKKRPPLPSSPAQELQGLSKRKMKKLERNPKKTWPPIREGGNKLCLNCPNIAGTKCDFGLCKQCCKTKCFTEELDCLGHKIWVKTKREKARAFVAQSEPTILPAVPDYNDE